MSFLANLFGNATPATSAIPPVAPTGVANPGQPLPGTAASNQTANNGTVPAGAAQTGNPGNTGDSSASPLAKFEDVWKTPDTATNDQTGGMFANLDPAKLLESARKVDFSKAVTPETLSAITAGGPEAAQALVTALNAVAQQGYAQSAMATAKIVDQALQEQAKNFQRDLPNQVKRFSVSENMAATNPLLSNPAVQPMAEALKEMLIRKNPNATAAEINTQIGDYFSTLGSAFAPKPAETPAQKQARANEVDWSSFLG